MPTTSITIGSPLLYFVFFSAVIVMITIDILALNKRGNQRVTVKEALCWTLIWVGVALLFNLALWGYLAHDSSLVSDPTLRATLAQQKALEFLTGYIIEKSLSFDNLFVFLMIFSYFKVDPAYQRRVLVYGVLGAVVLRVIMIALGAALVSEFAWILYIFGAFLIFTGIKMMLPETQENLENNRMLGWLQRHIRVSDSFHGERFFVVQNGVRIATPLLLVLLMVELSDVVFAVDSIPAIFAVTLDPFIVITSNIFAILGLRALYFLLADMADRFYLLKYGLAIVLMFIGIKMMIVHWIHIPALISLSVVLGVLLASIALSLMASRKMQ